MGVEPPWVILCIDDEKDFLRQLHDFLEDETVDDAGTKPVVLTDSNFGEGLARIEAARIDLVILDVRDEDGSEKGLSVLDEIKKRRFLPVIFYTALPGAVHEEESPLLRIVTKGDDLNALLGAVRETIGTGLPALNRALIRHVERVQRDYMWDFVAKNWDALRGAGDATTLAHLTARRLAVSLSAAGVSDLAKELGAEDVADTVGVPPTRYYILPHIEPTELAGDLFRGSIRDVDGYWVLLTPSCDIAQEKADSVVLARCLLLDNEEEYTAWKAKLPNPSGGLNNKLVDLLKNNRRTGQPDRYHFLPAALTIPNLLVDFQSLERIETEELENLERLCSLDSPFAEALVSRFLRYWGRLGTPDLDTASILESLRHQAQE